MQSREELLPAQETLIYLDLGQMKFDSEGWVGITAFNCP